MVSNFLILQIKKPSLNSLFLLNIFHISQFLANKALSRLVLGIVVGISTGSNLVFRIISIKNFTNVFILVWFNSFLFLKPNYSFNSLDFISGLVLLLLSCFFCYVFTLFS